MNAVSVSILTVVVAVNPTQPESSALLLVSKWLTSVVESISCLTIFDCSTHLAPVDSILSSSMYIVRDQLSDGGSRIIPPANVITLNGLIFSTSVACGWSNQSTSVYASVIMSPVFWQFVSSNCKLEFKSAVAKSICGLSANSALKDQKSTALHISLFLTSTSIFDPVSGVKSINLLSLKLLTAKPLLNRSKPSASLTWNDLVSNSRAFRVVNVSRLSILFSRAPISLIVNLRLSCNLIDGCLTVS